MPTDAARGSVVDSETQHPDRFICLSRALVVQILAGATTALVAAPVAPWPVVATWLVLLLGVAWLEERLLSVETMAGITWQGLRALSSGLYALAAAWLIARGTPASAEYAVVLMSCSMVYTLMRLYNAPLTFALAIAPHVLVLGLVGTGLMVQAFSQGEALAAATPVATMAIFAILFWSARAQLAGSWTALMRARAEAEEREKAAENANRAKSHFLAAMSHEFRTPLNGVLGMAQAMTGEALSPEQRERLKIIRRSGENLLAVLNDLLDLSKIEACKLELDIGDFDMEHLIRGVAAAFSPMAAKKGVCFDFVVDDSAKGRFQGDSARIRRILYNLASNAVKFTETGAVTLAIARQDGAVTVRVADTGIGMSPETIDQLFGGFFQADPSYTRAYDGTGLGLAVCHELVTLMDGTIRAESTLGEGSVFIVTLPLAEAAAADPSEAGATGQRPDNARLRVLAAEDNETNQVVLRTLLAQAGVEPFIVSTGCAALAAWEREPWDIILMDIQMPEMDGVTAARAIRLREAETGRPRTPILAVTANAMAHQVGEYDAAGMDGVIPKPIEALRLLAVMDAHLGAPDAGSGAQASPLDAEMAQAV